MVEHELLGENTLVQPLSSQKSPWAGLFRDLLNGETAYIYGTLEELRVIRRRVLSAYHFRKRSCPDFNLKIGTKLGVVNTKTALIISRDNSVGGKG